MIHFCHEDLFNFANSVVSDLIPYNVAFHLGIHWLTKYLFLGIQDIETLGEIGDGSWHRYNTCI